MNEWHDLFVATAGASAALTGLIFVGVSINLSKILSLPTVPERALLALVFLLTILILSILMLIPNQPLIVIGIEVTILGVILWAVTIKTDLYVYKKTDKDFFNKYYFRNVILNQVTVILNVVGGIVLCCGNANGFYWLIAGFIFSIIKSIIDSWVLLVEINR